MPGSTGGCRPYGRCPPLYFIIFSKVKSKVFDLSWVVVGFEGMWKILSTKTIFKHPRIELLEDRVQLPDGTETDYLKFKKGNGCTTVICQRKDGAILLQKEYSHPIGKRLWQLPGGGLNDNETPEQGADRELQEESKMKGSEYQIIGSYLMNNRRSENLMYVIVAKDLESVTGLPDDLEENVGSFWKTPQEVDEMIRTGEMINCHALASWAIYKLKEF